MADISGYIAPLVFTNRCQGHVHSIFQSSLNLCFRDTCSNISVTGEENIGSPERSAMQLVHIGSNQGFLSCFGIVLPQNLVASILAEVQVGDICVFQKGQLRIYAQQVLSFDLTNSNIEDMRLDHGISSPFDRRSWSDMAAHMQAEIEALGVFRKSILSSDQTAQKALKQLAKAQSVHEIACCQAALLGRGIGLTPSGDDALVGYGCALSLLGKQAPFIAALKTLDLSKTVDVAANYLQALMAGWVSKPLYRLSCSLQEGTHESLDAALRDILTFGHTSGADTLLGFSSALINHTTE